MVRFDPRRLALLRELERRGSVTAVADVVHLTPTAVSQQLKVLEREAGEALLRRVGRGVELTEAGLALAAAAADLEVAQARVETAWQTYRGQVAGTVRLSVFPTAGQRLLPGLLNRLAAHPDLVLDVVEADLHGDEYAARCDHADLVLAHRSTTEGTWAEAARTAPWAGRGLVATDLAGEPLDVGLPPGHPLAAASEISLDDVADETWIGVPEGWPFDRALEAWFATGGVRPRVAYRFTDLRMQEALVAAGHGIGLLPRYAVDDRDGARIALRPTAGITHGRWLAALARADRAERAAVRVVLGALVAEARAYAA